ncbi:MAG: octanoyltransferase [Cryomorphaceae bacterium BACL7 MAG-120910-bin2]|jgi:lipoyl(octanoyl) transferase|nr:MAG: octanoyltransferase [Cryomorphaceae bacterium BACL7 MAG-120910-bin2]KRO69189.1 MAG: octanoyltransferase [Cryomorphaceae bacterium BACL7 MAG-120322-bin74]KRO83866.1 MAG: octanoyltransferase [Cryomorphaceae bacterium BACL7 MAG-121220-bin83]NQW24977.1 lipoyl(octanoyl) transferase LipB [Cryomorphaceae bacterium]|tara:strand:+ start:1147 stop:1908 length:762 start_codon:yes stop_codon:yes gene_type:complete
MSSTNHSKPLRSVRFADLGVMDYQEAWDIQEAVFSGILARKSSNRNQPEEAQTPTEDHLLFVEHNHVYTLGKSGDMANLLANETELKALGIAFYKINRGGDITYHGPGQLVGYPILDLDHHFTDIHRYLRTLEDVIIDTLAEYGLKGDRSPGETGVWLDVGTPFARKICAMGVRASRWVTMHGWAFNVNTDLTYFQHIVPCGITDKAVTSLHLELERPVDEVEVKAKVLGHFARHFQVEIGQVSATTLLPKAE